MKKFRLICVKWDYSKASEEFLRALRKNPERNNLEFGKRDNPESENLEKENLEREKI